VFMKGFGVANVDTGEPIRPVTLFRIASLTKMLTATALLSQVANDQKKLDEPIGAYVPGLSQTLSRLTAAQLLTHTAGIAHNVQLPQSSDEGALAASIKSWTDAVLFTDPGQIFSYSNAGYCLAGFALESITKQRYADAMRSQLFQPLGMTATTFRLTDAITWPVAQAHARQRDGSLTILRPFPNEPAAWPPGSTLTNVQDLSRFVLAFLNAGRIDGKQVLDPAIIAAMTTPRVQIPTNSETAYGFGLFLSTKRGVRMWEHGGSLDGYGATIRMAPEYHVGIVILANLTGAEMPETAAKALEMLLPLQLAPSTTPPAVLPPTTEDLQRHPGLYRNLDEEVEILAENRQLFVKRGQQTRPLVKRSETQFDSDRLGSYVFSSNSGVKTWYVSTGNLAYARVAGR
jgi:CubicO group peptidase (beta-lactamase class C family)